MKSRQKIETSLAIFIDMQKFPDDCCCKERAEMEIAISFLDVIKK